jgi:hypothetical protein
MAKKTALDAQKRSFAYFLLTLEVKSKRKGVNGTFALVRTPVFRMMAHTCTRA